MFIVIEGPDGVGKTSVQRLVNEYLTNMGYRSHTHREPGGLSFGESVRDVLFEYADIAPLTQLLMFSASRNELLRELKMADHPREIFLFDRYVLSSYVYQYDAYYQNRTLTEMLFEHTFQKPEMTFILTASIRTLMERTLSKADTNHFDVTNPKDIAVLEHRRNLYHTFGRENEYAYLVDAERALPEVATDIVNQIVQRYSEYYGG